jgi:hypothetical protein
MEVNIPLRRGIKGKDALPEGSGFVVSSAERFAT